MNTELLKTTKVFGILGLVIIVGIISSCATAQKKHMQAYAEYTRGNYEKSIALFEPLKTKQDKNYLLYMLDIGTAYLTAGDIYDSEKYFLSVEKTLDKQISDLKTAEQLVVSDQQKIFFGDPHDKVMTHVFLGLGYFVRENYDAAEIEFKKALESDRGKETKYEGDLVTAYYFLGEIYFQRHDYDNAAVALKRVAELNPDFPFAWLGLYRIARQTGNKDDLDKYLAEYRKFDPGNAMLENAENKARVLIISMLGWGPMKRPDPLLGVMSLTQQRSYPTVTSEISFYQGENQGASQSKDHLADDVYFQASTQGGFAAQLAKKAVGAIARRAISKIPLVGSLSGLILGDDEADVRFWYTLPGRINLSEVYLTPGLYHTKVSMFDNKDLEQEHYRQVWYYIPVKPEKTTILLFRSIYDLQNQAKKK